MNPSGAVQDPACWDRFAAAYDAGFSAFTALFARDAVRLAGIGPGHRVLDVAAGTGAAAFAAAEAGADVLATDFSPAMLDTLQANANRRGFGEFQTEVMDGQHLAVEENAFDAALSSFGRMFFPDRAAGFGGLHRTLKPGGRAVVSAWTGTERMRFQRTIQAALERAAPDFPLGGTPPHWQALGDRDVFMGEMEAAGFSRVNGYTVTHLHTFPSPEELWDGHIPMAPPLTEIMAALTPTQNAAFREAFIGLIRAEQGDGPFGLESEAHLVVGVK